MAELTAPGNRTVTRADLIDAAWAVSYLRRRDIEELVEATLEWIVAGLVSGETVKISRFCIFTPVHKAARVGRNPRRPEETHEIPAHRRVRFKATNELKHFIRTGRRE